MAHDDSAKAQASSKLVIRNIGFLLSGEIDKPKRENTSWSEAAMCL
jgi:hypothetical protein